MEILSDDNASESRFPLKKPLPPIGGGGDNEEIELPNSDSETEDEQINSKDEDERSTASNASSTARQKQGSGKSRPAVLRGFRREAPSEPESGTEKSSGDGTPTGRKSRSRKTEVMKKKTYDGREVTFITENTQTDWDWLEEAEKSGKARLLGPRDKKDNKQKKDSCSTPTKSDSKGKKEDSKTDIPVVQEEPSGPSPYPINDEFGVPMLELSSDSDTSSDEEEYTGRKVQDDRTFMPSIGPPQILQYNRESEKKEIEVSEPSERAQDEDEAETDEQGRIHGMFGGTCEFCGHAVQPWPTLEQQQTVPPDQLYCCNEYREFVEYTTEQAQAMETQHLNATKKISISSHPHYGSSKEDRKVAKERALQRMREKEMQRKQQEASGFQQQSNFYSFAQKMKTINYQLSSQKCLEEGWTVRPPSPLTADEGDDAFIPEPLNIDLIRSGRLGLVEKFYESGQKFLTMFPDGTGNIFYPSGSLAIAISSVQIGQFNYVVHAEMEKSSVLAVFEPNGYASCYHPNGVVRLCMDQLGGIELDDSGAKRRKWLWKDQVTHVHAPPFQPIHFSLNQYIGVRILSQERMVLDFSCGDRGKRFNVGSRLKLNHVEKIPPKEIDENHLYLEEQKIRVEKMLDKVATLLKFPKSPKIDKILPPLHVTSKALKTERLRQERANQIASQEAKKTKQAPIPALS
ncbi:glutamate-rich protein 6-like isoform X9 [Crassostrea angulata]|uniref:glutamate-rich protein 6-like isoform X9 n=1 Tax=Magallana angulata TaxID=2784310 RepID=UPI0022B0C3CB|nr:glutamate-rich protein 6-like isoform X9 [Crassostrea angulata]